MPMCQSIHPSIIWQHAVPYVIVWVEMAKCRSVHRNIIWQHAGPYVVLWVEMATWRSVHSNIIWQHAHTIKYGLACCHIMFRCTDQHVAISTHTITYGPACSHIMFGWTDWHNAISFHTIQTLCMATCRSIRYTMGRNGNVLVSPSKHYVWQHAIHTLY